MSAVNQLRATLRTEGFGNKARSQLRALILDILNPEGTYRRGRDSLDLLSMVQLFKMSEFRQFFLYNLLTLVPQDISEVSMELLSDLCRVVLRESNNAGDFESIAAVFCIGNGFYVHDGGVRSSMLLNLRHHEAWGMTRLWEHIFGRVVAFEENTADVLGGAAKALLGLSPARFRETLLLLRFTALTRDVVFFDLPPEISAVVGRALTALAKEEIPRLREAFPEPDASFLSASSRFRSWVDLTMTLAKHPAVARETAGLLDLLVCLAEGPMHRRVDLAAYQALAPDGGADLASRFACGHSSLRDLLVGVVAAAALKEDAMDAPTPRSEARDRGRKTSTAYKCSLSGVTYRKWDLLGALGSRGLRDKLPRIVSEETYRDLVMPSRDAEPRLYRVGYGVGAAVCYAFEFGHVPNVNAIADAAYEVIALKGSAATAIQAAFRGHHVRKNVAVKKWRSDRIALESSSKWGHERWQTMDDDLIDEIQGIDDASEATPRVRKSISGGMTPIAENDAPAGATRQPTSPRSPSSIKARTFPHASSREEDPRTPSAAVRRNSSASKAERLAQRQREFEDFVTRLRGGIDVKKHGRRGRPHVRTVFLFGDVGKDAKLCWVAPGRAVLKPNPKSAVDLNTVRSVKVGKDHSRFEGLISLDCTTRMLILEPPTDEARQQLVRGFVQLVDHTQNALR
mmetsp:Transcript_42007/g.131560  ORF Transcript_42007/g.131560 Transcript_42007/m.131560 type:complete len:684 (-) Transcript_42007:338-2389(-)